MRTILIALALTMAACACGIYAADDAHDAVVYSTRGDGMQCVTIGGRTYCDSGCRR
jgi:hypothetical protein